MRRWGLEPVTVAIPAFTRATRSFPPSPDARHGPRDTLHAL